MGKTYDYDAIIDATKDSSKISNHLNALYDEIINFRKMTTACEDVFHSKDEGVIKDAYNSIYMALGKSNISDPEKGYGMWGDLGLLISILNELNKNATTDKSYD
jgi:hypothetical protein